METTNTTRYTGHRHSTPPTPQGGGTEQQDSQRWGQDTPERRTVALEGSLRGVVAAPEVLNSLTERLGLA